MKKIFQVALIFLMIVSCGCGNEKSAEQPAAPAEPKIEQPAKPLISRSAAQAKLNELSAGLNVRYDDMKEITFCHCPINYDVHPGICIIPYVVVDKNYDISLRQDILYVGREPLRFDKLYIKTSSGVETFHYEETIKSVDGGYFGEEYVGLMDDNLHKKLQTAIDEGGAKFRLEGRTFAERELTQKELSDMAKVFALYEFFNSVKVEN